MSHFGPEQNIYMYVRLSVQRIKCAEIVQFATRIVTICTHTKQMQAARILYTCVQFVHILHMCTLHVCCIERNIMCSTHTAAIHFCKGLLSCAFKIKLNESRISDTRHGPI